MSCCHAVERMNERIDGVGSVHDEDQGVCLTSVKYPVWIGGSILSFSVFPQLWTSKGEFDESAPLSSTDVCLSVLYLPLFFFSLHDSARLCFSLHVRLVLSSLTLYHCIL